MTGHPRIDAHHHLWTIARGDYVWMTPDQETLCHDYVPDDLRPLLDAAGVEETLLVQAADTVEETRFLLACAHDVPWIRGVVGWVDMESPAVSAVLDELAGSPFLRGIRPMIQDIEDPDWMLGDTLRPAFQAVEARGLAFDALVKPPQWENLLILARREENLRIVIDHAAKPTIGRGKDTDALYGRWQQLIVNLAACPNTVVKCSGLVTEADSGWTAPVLEPYVTHLLDTFGPDRVLWGSDWPVLNMAGSYADWHEASMVLLEGLDAEEQSLVFGGNALRIYCPDSLPPVSAETTC